MYRHDHRFDPIPHNLIYDLTPHAIAATDLLEIFWNHQPITVRNHNTYSLKTYQLFAFQRFAR